MNLLFAAAGVGLAVHWSGGELRRFERLAAEDIRSKLHGDARQVSVRAEMKGPLGGLFGEVRRVTIRARSFSTDGLPLFTEPERSKRGRVQDLRIVLDDFTLRGLRIEHLEASIPSCRFDLGLALSRKQIRLSRSGVGTGRVRILESDLEQFVLRKYREIKRVRVRVDRHHVFVEGYGEFLVIQTNFFVIAKLAPVGGNKLELTDAKVFFDDRRADEASKRAVLDTLNPVVDLNADLKLFGAIQLEGVRLVEGVLEAWGKTRIPERPPEPSPPFPSSRESGRGMLYPSLPHAPSP